MCVAGWSNQQRSDRNLARALRGVLYGSNIPNLSAMSDAVRLNPNVIIGSVSLDLHNEKLLRSDAARF